MDDIKKHAFWILLGAILLAEAGFYYFTVFTKSQEIGQAIGGIRERQDELEDQTRRADEGKPVPSEGLLEFYRERRGLYEQEEESVHDYLLAKDRDFEPYADEPAPPLDRYRAEYEDNFNTLVREFLEKLGGAEEGRVDGGFKREKNITEKTINQVEKRLRIQKALSDVAIKTGAVRLNRIQFQDRKTGPGVLTKKMHHFLHPVSLDGEWPGHRVSEVLAELLRMPSIPTRLTRVMVSKISVLGARAPESESESYLTVNVYERVFENEEEDLFLNLEDDEILPEPAVHVEIYFDVIDVVGEEVLEEE